jgi:hypothetical protein
MTLAGGIGETTLQRTAAALRQITGTVEKAQA